MNDSTPSEQPNCTPAQTAPSPAAECPPPSPSPCPPPCPAPAPQDPPCPKAKDCPKPPTRPCPPKVDPCAETPAPTPTEPPAPPAGTPPCNPAGKTPAPLTPAQQQLETLRTQLEAGQTEMLKFDPLKNRLADLTTRIASLEKAIAAQPAASTAYTTFYNAVQDSRASLDCSIPTVRCQLELSEKSKTCVRTAISTVDARVKKAQADRDSQNADVARRTARQEVLDADMAWAKRWNDFFTTGLQAQVTKLRDDLKVLKGLVDSSKDPCEVWFYLTEMEAILKSARTDADGKACYVEDLNIATFLDCWSPKCYATASQHWIVTFNEADAAAKAGKAELATQTERATALEKAAAEALATRREAILKEIRAQDCCGPLSKCP